MRIALISEVFDISADANAVSRLQQHLYDARAAGATLAVLPELPLNPWSPATEIPRDEDAEAPGGPRHAALAAAARAADIGIVGGVIQRDSESGRRTNTALIFKSDGLLVGSYSKVHLPDEDGFREPCHYEPGRVAAGVIHGFDMPFGVQVCSDINRPEGSHLLAAAGASLIINPRATESSTFERWKLIFRAIAMTSASYVVSVNRPRAEHGVPLGGPSIVVDPDGQVAAESTDAVLVVTLDQEAGSRARTRYPGYLKVYPEIYARAWSAIASES